ncbi:MAG: hypothetical protein P8M25_01350 [Paracoccaceae bacterium]|nr:hypothetical protein [Paracoccaceae bacterium]
MAANTALADSNHAQHRNVAILFLVYSDKVNSLEILATHAHRDGNKVTLHMTPNGTAGADPAVTASQMRGIPSTVYFWPASLDHSTVRFNSETCIRSMSLATRPNF